MVTYLKGVIVSCCALLTTSCTADVWTSDKYRGGSIWWKLLMVGILLVIAGIGIINKKK